MNADGFGNCDVVTATSVIFYIDYKSILPVDQIDYEPRRIFADAVVISEKQVITRYSIDHS